MHNESNDYSLGMVAFLTWAFIGAGIALLLAPQSGTETRTLLRDYAGKAKDEMYERGREAKETFDSALAYETGKEAMRGAQETGRNRG